MTSRKKKIGKVAKKIKDEKIKDRNIMRELAGKIASLSWEEKTLVAIIVCVFLIHLMTLLQFEHLPSPIYGGDIYRDRGFVQSIANGKMPWEDAHYAGHQQYYSWLIFGILGFATMLTGLSVNFVFMYYTLLVTVLAPIIFYLIGRALFRNKVWALFLAATVLVITGIFPSPKSSYFGAQIILPLFLLFWLKLEKYKKTSYSVYAGIALGLLALVQGGRFLTGMGIFAIGAGMLFLFDIKKFPVKEYVKKYLPAVVIAIMISMIFFLPLYLKYGFHQPNPVTQYADNKIELFTFGTLIKNTLGRFFNFSGIFYFIMGLLGILGLIHIFLNFKKIEYKLVLIWYLANMLLVQHHVVTRPLLDWHFLPGQLNYFSYLFIFFVAIGIKSLYGIVRKQVPMNYFVIAVFVLLLVPMTYVKINEYNDDRWVQYGKTFDATTQKLYEMGDWFRSNLRNDESVLSFDETGFAITALSGKPVVITRRTHASYFVDIDKRIADAAVIMYGNNSNKSRELLSKYGVKYFYEDTYLHQGLLKTRLEFSEYLSRYGVKHSIEFTKLDPARPDDEAHMQDLVVIPSQPLREEFKSMLVAINAFQINGQVHSVVYGFN